MNRGMNAPQKSRRPPPCVYVRACGPLAGTADVVVAPTDEEMKKKTATQAAPRDGRAKEAPPRVTRRGRARRLFRRPTKQPPLEHAGLESIAAFEYRPPGDDGL